MKKNKALLIVAVVAMVAFSCVPVRKFEDLEARHNQTIADKQDIQAELDKYKWDNARLFDELDNMSRTAERLREDTFQMGRQFRRLQQNYDQYVDQMQKMMAGQSEEMRLVMSRLQSTQEDLQRREDALNNATRELEEKERRLDGLMADVLAKESRVNELEEILMRQDSIVENLRSTLSTALLGYRDQGLSVEIRGGKVYVSMEENLLFATGSTRVDRQGELALKELAKVLQDNPDINIMIEGHTDNVPIRPGSAIQDNWDLSVLRATSILRILLKHGDIEPTRFIAAGRGEYHPVDPEDTPEARRKNRRTEIILTPELDELFRIIEQH